MQLMDSTLMSAIMGQRGGAAAAAALAGAAAAGGGGGGAGAGGAAGGGGEGGPDVEPGVGAPLPAAGHLVAQAAALIADAYAQADSDSDSALYDDSSSEDGDGGGEEGEAADSGAEISEEGQEGDGDRVGEGAAGGLVARVGAAAGGAGAGAGVAHHGAQANGGRGGLPGERGAGPPELLPPRPPRQASAPRGAVAGGGNAGGAALRRVPAVLRRLRSTPGLLRDLLAEFAASGLFTLAPSAQAAWVPGLPTRSSSGATSSLVMPSTAAAVMGATDSSSALRAWRRWPAGLIAARRLPRLLAAALLPADVAPLLGGILYKTADNCFR